MKCLLQYEWVKLLRSRLPEGKGILGDWARLASRAAFRKGQALYCGHSNDVCPGMWAGGVVGLKSILGKKNRTQALETLERLSSFGYIEYDLNAKTKKLTYRINDWVLKCSGEECLGKAVYTTDGYGFLCLPRSIPDRLAAQQYKFEEADAWLDLWCHTVFEDPHNAFSFLAPTVQYGKYGAVLTLESLGKRWGWEKTKVFRFFKKHGDVFRLTRLNGSFGCLVFNILYPTGIEFTMPRQEDIVRITNEIRICDTNVRRTGSDHEHLNKLVAWYSRRIVPLLSSDGSDSECENRVAHFAPIYRVYLSLCRNCKNCEYDCVSKNKDSPADGFTNQIRGPCMPTDLTKTAKENFRYEKRRKEIAV